MDVRSDSSIRRLLVAVVCCVFCYVIFYNSLFLDRRRVKLPMLERLVYRPGNGSSSTQTAEHPGSPAQPISTALAWPPSTQARPAPSQIPAAAAAGRASESPAKPTPAAKSKSTAKQTPKPTPKSTTKRTPMLKPKPTPTPRPGTVIEDMFEGGFRIANGGRCPESGQRLRLVILITSAPGHERQRKAIRLTWGTVALRRDVALVFFVGRTSEQLQAVVDAEQTLFGDMVQGEFVDAYRNLTLKSVSMLEWLDTYCGSAHMVLKTDDDMFINTENVLTFANAHWKDRNTLFGKLARRWKPIRNAKSKYYLSPQAFPGKYLPDFMTGPAYMLTGDLVSSLHKAALSAVFLPLEDVLVTGVVGEQLKVRRVHAKEFINDRIKIDTCKFQTAVSVHMVRFEEQFDIWKRISDGRSHCASGYRPTGG
ncbi:beta-1,3-galactosyltransferase 5-like [Pollicipes pollicipes]|uniref:beta-1,3-galactosyltransferase 5-like n=1 Tax=Pollicipes pollicipes TaxID=41117 RepID=UPI00188562EC|nr:beta-1,3-galactosyltransferase 5-like [Pollicipes pollicipes]XP_037090519.1 beta-1,3-galactosyltransferase 5-like [Pollicipes pollicipes]